MLKVKLEKSAEEKYKYIEKTLTGPLPHLLYCINTPVNELDKNYDEKIKAVPSITEKQVAEIILPSGLYNDWGIDLYGVRLSYNLIASLRDMWVESVMREFYLRYEPNQSAGQAKAAIQKTLTSVAAGYQLTTLKKMSAKEIRALMNSSSMFTVDGTVRAAGNIGLYFLTSAMASANVAKNVVTAAPIVVNPAIALTGATAVAGAEVAATTALATTSVAAGGTVAVAGTAGGAAVGITAGPIIAAIVGIIGITQLRRILSVISVLDRSRGFEFDPSKSVYDTWGVEPNLLDQVGQAIADNRDNPEVQKALGEVSGEMEQSDADDLKSNFQQVAEAYGRSGNSRKALIETGKANIDKLENQVGISADIDRID